MALVSNIKLNKDPDEFYSSGETLSGVVEITTEEPTLVRAIRIKVRGVAAFVWTETSIFNSTTSYLGRENYINQLIYLVGSEEGAPTPIPAGLHTYNFSCLIPTELPSSIMVDHGEITYSVSLSIDQPWKKKIKHPIAFKLSNPVNLNIWLTPLSDFSEMETTKKFWCGFSKPLYLKVSIPRQGYTPGQLIKLLVEVKNQSNVDIKGVRASLMKIVQYNCLQEKMKTKKNITVEAEMSSPGIGKYQSQNLEIVLEVPKLMSTLNGFCRIILVNYELHIFADMSGIQREPDMVFPIVIGDTPLEITEGSPRNEPAILSVQNL